MKIWFLTFEAPEECGGGLSTYINNVINAYKEHKEDEIVVFILEKNNDKPKIENFSKNIKLVRFGLYKSEIVDWLGYLPAMQWHFSDAMESFATFNGLPDIIEAPDGFAVAYHAIQKRLCRIGILKDVPIVITVHTPVTIIDEWDEISIYQLPLYFTKESELFCLNAADGLIFISNLMKKYISKKINRNLDQFPIIRNPFKIECNGNNAEKQKEKKGFFISSRMVSWKGIEDAIKCFIELWDNYNFDEQLHLYGDDTFNKYPNGYIKYLKSKYYKYFDTKRIIYHGKKDYNTIQSIRNDYIAQIHPSKIDNFPYSVIEQIYCGGFSIINKNNGVAEIANEEDGLYVIDFSSPSDFYEVYNSIRSKIPNEITKINKKIANITSYENFIKEKTKYYKEIKKISVKKNNYTKRFPFLTKNKEIDDDIKEYGKQDLLSIIILCFNISKDIYATINSVLNSTYKNIEIIIINCGNTNINYMSYLKKFKKFENIKIVHTKNNSIAVARNTGIDLANGQFCAILDADDMVDSTYYEKCINILKKYKNVGFVGSWVYDFDDETNKLIRYWPTYNTELPRQIIFNGTNCQGIVSYTKIMKDYGKYDPNLKMFLDDWDAVIGIIEAGYLGVMIPEPLFKYRVRTGSIFMSNQQLWQINYQYIIDKHKNLFEKYAIEIIKFLNENGGNCHYHIPGHPSSGRCLSNLSASEKKCVKVIRKTKKLKRIWKSIIKRIKLN